MFNKKISSGTAHKVPEDLKKMLTSDSKILTLWNDLTPLARNEWICWVISVKREETREEHIKRMKEELKDGMKRPCCWYGCIHRKDKKVSKSVQGILAKRK